MSCRRFFIINAFRRLALLFVTLLAVVPCAFGQTEFKLERMGNGHFYFTADVCGESAQIMLESGLPALLIGRDFYERRIADSDLTVTESAASIILLSNQYKIAFKTDGRISVGGAIFDGPIFILDGFDGLSMPVQYLKDAVSGRSVITVDFNEDILRVESEMPKSHASSYRLKTDRKNGFPTVAADLKIETPDGKAKIKGDLIVDFGNPLLLFLMRQDKSLARSVKKEHIALQDARDGNGNIVAQAFYAIKVNMFGMEYTDVSIGVTDKMTAIKQTGFLGVPFFDTPVTFDFDKGLMMKEVKVEQYAISPGREHCMK